MTDAEMEGKFYQFYSNLKSVWSWEWKLNWIAVSVVTTSHQREAVLYGDKCLETFHKSKYRSLVCTSSLVQIQSKISLVQWYNMGSMTHFVPIHWSKVAKTRLVSWDEKTFKYLWLGWHIYLYKWLRNIFIYLKYNIYIYIFNIFNIVHKT